jgi:hypothetical protein
MPQYSVNRTADSQQSHHTYSQFPSPTSSMYSRPLMARPPALSSASPNGVHQDAGPGSSYRLGDRTHDEDDSSAASPNQHTPTNDEGAANRGTKRKSTGKAQASNGKEDDQAGGARRKKKAVSCEACRRRKLKCDRGWPCGACRDRNESHMCQWEGGTRPQATGRDQENAPLLVRMDRIESMLGAIADRIGLQQEGEQKNKTTLIYKPSNKRDGSTSNSRSREQSGGAASASIKSMLATGWQPTSPEEARSELLHVLDILPDTETVRRMCRYFFDDVDHLHYIVTDEFWERGLREHEELRMMSQSGSTVSGSRLGTDDNLRHHLQFLAMLLSICGLCLLFSDQDYGEVTKNAGVSSAYGVFLDNAQRAFNASNPYEEPTLMSVRFLILQFWAISVIRGLSAGMGMLALGIHQMYAMELDQEPPESMPAAERADRIRLFHSMALIDWFTAGSAKRSYTIREEPNRHPYLFGSKRFRDRIEGKDSIINLHQRIKMELARLNRRAVERTAMSETDAYNATIDIQQELDDLYTNLPAHYDLDLKTEVKAFDNAFLERLGLPLSISTQLISLHKRYYIQGWLDPAYRTSRDICFASARRVCSIFQKVYSPFLPIDKLMTTDIAKLQASLANRQNIISRLWYVSHSSVGACLLLQHHCALMEVYPDVAGPNTVQVRAEIDEDLLINKRILLALSVHSKIAKNGLALLTKQETSKQLQEEAGRLNQRGDLGTEDDEETRKRRAKLAMDLQSITDIDTFKPSKPRRQVNGASQAEVKYPPSSAAASSLQPINNTLGTLTTATGAPRDEMAEMEALLQSTFSTDLYTGLPLAPETSFQRQGDREAPAFLSSEVFTPSAAYSAAFLADYSSCNMNPSNCDSSAPHFGTSSHPVHVAKHPHSGSWF